MNSRPGYDILIALLQNYRSQKITSQHFSEMLKLISEACDRIPRADSQGRYQADLQLSLDGYTSNLVGSDGWYQPRLTFLKLPMPSETAREAQAQSPSASENWEVEIETKSYPCSVEEMGSRFHVIGPNLPLFDLVHGLTKPRFLCGGEAVKRMPISRQDRPSPVP